MNVNWQLLESRRLTSKYWGWLLGDLSIYLLPFLCLSSCRAFYRCPYYNTSYYSLWLGGFCLVLFCFYLTISQLVWKPWREWHFSISYPKSTYYRTSLRKCSIKFTKLIWPKAAQGSFLKYHKLMYWHAEFKAFQWSQFRITVPSRSYVYENLRLYLRFPKNHSFWKTWKSLRSKWTTIYF